MLFDADAHFAPKDAYDRMDGEFRDMRPRIIADGVGATMRFLGRNHPRVAHSFPVEQTCSFERRMTDLDRLGIDCQLLFPSHSGIYNEIADRGAARALVQNHNDGMAEVEHRSKGRLISTFCLTMQHPDLAVEELQRCVNVHKMRCAVISPNVDGSNIDDLPLWDFFAEAERLGVVLAFHGDADSKLVGWERFDRWRLFNCLGFPFDYMHGIVCMIYSGLLDRFPKLKLLFAEAGVSFLPFLEDRLNDTTETFHSPLAFDNFDIRRRPANKRPPTEYFSMFHHAVGLDESLLELVIGKYGTDKFLVGTDYPHPDAHMNVAKTVETLTSISPEAYEAMTWKNAERLFGLTDRNKRKETATKVAAE
jgi:aminocarboxymuconate-semialdehyde decarboxylase